MRIAAILALASVCLVSPAAAGHATAAARSGCTAKQTRAALVSFIRAYNAGDYAHLDALFAAEPDFQWYSTNAPGQRLGFGSHDRAGLIAYFRARHARHDRFGLRSFGFNGNSPRYGNFEMRMRRRVDGYRGGDWFLTQGKGALVCSGDEARFIVVTLATQPAGVR